MKKIPLTRGKYAIVDDKDYEWLNQWKWHTSKERKQDAYYAVRSVNMGNGKIKTFSMHREILGLERNDGVITDHINRKGLDNRRCNLRKCTSGQNTRNQGIRCTNKSGYKGVYFKKDGGRFCAMIRVNYKSIYLGCFDTKKNAAIAYNDAAKKNFGQFANLNLL